MAILTPSEFPLVGVQFKMSFVKQSAQNDIAVFSDAGLMVFAARLPTGAAANVARATLAATEGSTISTTLTTIGYGSGTANARKSGGYYAKIDNEIIYVGKDTGYASTTGLLQGVVRGALGTTPATHASNATITLLNSFVLGDNQTSQIEFVWAALPPDPRGVDLAKTTSTPGSIPSVT